MKKAIDKNEEDKLKNQYYQKLLKVQIGELIFTIIFLLIIFLRFTNVINTISNLIPYFLLSILLYAIIIVIICIFYMIKFTNAEKMFFKKIIISFLTLLLLGFLSSGVDISHFFKKTDRTTGSIYNITSEIIFKQDSCSGGIRRGTTCCTHGEDELCTRANDYYRVYDTYYVKYNVNGIAYTNEYQISKDYKTKYKAEKAEPKYKIGDKLPVFYDRNNPINSRANKFIFPNILVYILSISIVLIQSYSFIKTKKIKKSCKI